MNTCKALIGMGQFHLKTQSDSVSIPESFCPLTELQMNELATVVSPLQDSETYGIDLYTATVQFVMQYIQSDQ